MINPINILHSFFGLFDISQETPADVVISNGKCKITKERLESIRKRAEPILSDGISSAYADFPINRNRLESEIETDFLTEGNICDALLKDTKITCDSYKKDLKKYKSNSLAVNAARAKGLISQWAPVFVQCPKKEPSLNPTIYSGIKTCEALKSIVEKGYDSSLPLTMSAVAAAPEKVQDFLDEPVNATFYYNYSNGGPLTCNEPNTSFHAIKTGKGNIVSLNYITHTMKKPGWIAWQNRRSCTTIKDGKTRNADDFTFNFGMNTTLPLNVEVDGQKVTHTLVISALAAGGDTTPIGAKITKQLAYPWYLGKEFALKMSLKAKLEKQCP